MSVLKNLGIALTVVFAGSLVALAAQVAWVIWRRSIFLRNNGAVLGGRDREGDDASHGAFREPVTATKELLYFFCWKDSQSSSRVEPDSREAAATTEGIVVSEDSDEVLKWHTMHRESRMLYTIKEEEKEGEAAAETHCSGGGGLTPDPKGKDERRKEKMGKRFCLKECLEAKEKDVPDRESAIILVKPAEESVTELTPFSTPCGSPDRYFTPSPSPPRTEQDGVYVDHAKMAALC